MSEDRVPTFEAIRREALAALDARLRARHAEGAVVDTAALEQASRQVGEALAANWSADTAEVLAGEAAKRQAFERELRAVWGSALDALAMLIAAVEELGDAFVADISGSDRLFDVLGTLHARACSTAHEVHWALSGGYPRSAEARCRTLYEIVATMRVLGEYGRDDDGVMLNRYLDHAVVSELRYYEELEAHHEALGMRQPDPQVVPELRRLHDEATDRYGKVFKQSCGWAALVVPSGNMKDLRKKAGLKHLEPVFALQSDAVHVGSGSLDAHLIRRDGEVFRRSNVTMHGLSLAGFTAADSLHRATHVLVGWARGEADLGFVAGLAVSNALVRVVHERFSAVDPAFAQVREP